MHSFISSPGLIFVRKTVLVRLFSEGFIIGGNFAFQNGLDLTIKTANFIINSPWAYIREGSLSQGYLRLRFGGLIFGKAYFWEGLLSAFYMFSRLIVSDWKLRRRGQLLLKKSRSTKNEMFRFFEFLLTTTWVALTSTMILGWLVYLEVNTIDIFKVTTTAMAKATRTSLNNKF